MKEKRKLLDNERMRLEVEGHGRQFHDLEPQMQADNLDFGPMNHLLDPASCAIGLRVSQDALPFMN